MAEHSENVTELLLRLGGSGPELDLLFERLYDELRAIAARRLQSEREGHTLSATALVNEAYLKLADLDRLTWKNRAQFFAIAAGPCVGSWSTTCATSALESRAAKPG